MGRSRYLAGVVPVTALPQPLVMTDRYVVLTPEQWGNICVSRRVLPAPYVPAWSEGFGRHVIVQNTLGM